MKKYISINIFENEKYRINKVKDNFKDQFEIIEKEDILYVKRLDKNEGWGANLRLNIFDKVNNEEYIKNIGSSFTNELQINLKKIVNKNHYENNFYKLYNISNYNDLFNINYDNINKNLTVKRLDTNTGWDQELVIEYYEKISENIKHINFGPSKTNTKIINIDINKIDYIKIPNIYIDSIIKIFKIKNEYDDKFYIDFDHDTNFIKIKRGDAIEGWGQNLMINVEYKNDIFEFYIGSSNENILYKKLNFKNFKTYVCLTSIPSRFDILNQNLNDFVKKQNYNFDKIFITIPKKYKRFNNFITQEQINILKKIDKVNIIEIDEDLGPASKYLGPLIKKKININDLIIVIDDDRIYNKNLVRHFAIAYRSYSYMKFFSGLWSYFFDKSYKFINKDFLEISMFKEKNKETFKFGNGLGGFFGFAMIIKNQEEFIQYHYNILNRINKSFFHDEGILLGYLKKKEEFILYLKHFGCEEYSKETIDALCMSGLCDRQKIEKEIFYITNYELLL